MSLYEVNEDVLTASKLAAGFEKEANLEFENQLLKAEDLIKRFWFRNTDENGNPSLEGDEPTGIELLQAMGTKAKFSMTAAYLRVEMLIKIATAAGKAELVDLTKVAAPYDLVFNEDGSLDSWTLRE